MLGGIYSGIFTPTETAAVISIYCLILAFAYKALTAGGLLNIIAESVRAVMMMSVICTTSQLFAYVLTLEKVPQRLVSFFSTYVTTPVVFWIAVIVLFLVLGCFLDDSVSQLIIVPLLLPIATGLGIQPLHFCIISTILIVMGLCTPPVGMVLYMLQGVSSLSYERIAKAVVPYLLITLIGVVILIIFPQITMVLPTLLFK